MWLTKGTADFTKLMDIAAANASRLTPQERIHVAYGLSCVWGAISYGVVVGSHGLKNAIAQRLLKGGVAQAREAKRSDEIDEVVHRHRDILWHNKPSFAKNRLGTAKQIHGAVNADLAKMAIGLLSENAIRKRI
jgi:hypothetical protein